MKTLLKYALLLAGCTGLISCNNFLDLSPVSQVPVRDFYRTGEDIKIALESAYAALASDGQYNSQFYLAEVPSDNTTATGTSTLNFDNFTVDPLNAVIERTWTATYQGIARCNAVLDRIDPIPMDATLKEQYKGEARFLRALQYFNLVRFFGDVPLVLHEVTNQQEAFASGREPAAAVYEAIIADLLAAEASLPTFYTASTDIGRATKGAAMTLLGKVYLTRKQYEAAAQKLKEVIDLNTYILLPNYASNFGPSNKNNRESIFEIQYRTGGFDLGSPFASLFGRRGDFIVVFGVLAGNDQNVPTQEFLNTYERDQAGRIIDRRFTASMDSQYVDTKGNIVRQTFVKKYLFPQALAFDGDSNWPVLRYADVLLMYAEALNEAGGPTADAFQAINAVRTRAGLAPLAGLNYAGLKLAIEKERRIELAFENHRWFDLVRWGKAVAVMNAHFRAINSRSVMQPHQVLLPVPQSQIDVNPSRMCQNPGYTGNTCQ